MFNNYDWLFQGLILELILFSFNSLFKIIFKNTNNIKEKDMYKIKNNFHFYLICLASFSFFNIFTIIIAIIENDYFVILFGLSSIAFQYFLVTNEFNKLWKQLYSNKFQKHNNK